MASTAPMWEIAAALAQSSANTSVGRMLTAAEQGLQGVLDGLRGQTAAAACDKVGYQLIQTPGVIPGHELTDQQVALCHSTVIDKRTGTFRTDMLTNACALSDLLALGKYPTDGEVFEGGKVHIRVVVPFEANNPLHPHWKTYTHGAQATSEGGGDEPLQADDDVFLLHQAAGSRIQCRAIIYGHLESYLKCRTGPPSGHRARRHLDTADLALYAAGDLFEGLDRYGGTCYDEVVEYQEWVADCHPEDVIGGEIDARHFLPTSEHLLIWNEFFWYRGFADDCQAIARLPATVDGSTGIGAIDQPCGGPDLVSGCPSEGAATEHSLLRLQRQPPSDAQKTSYGLLIQSYRLTQAALSFQEASRAPFDAGHLPPAFAANPVTSSSPMWKELSKAFCVVAGSAFKNCGVGGVKGPSSSRRKGAVSTISTMAFNRAMGVHNLLIVDVVLPLAFYTAIDRLATNPMGSEKVAPAFLIGRSQSCVEALATNNGTDSGDLMALRTAGQLVMCAKIADLACTTTRHVTITCIEGGGGFKQDPVKALTAVIDVEVDALRLAVLEKHGEIKLCVPLRDPPRKDATLPEEGITAVAHEEAFFEWLERRESGLGGGAVQTGPNLVGIECPLDTASPATLLGAVNRHFANMEAEVDGGIPVDGKDTYTFTLDKGKGMDPLLAYARVKADILIQDMAALRRCMKAGLVGVYIDGNGPGSQSEDKFREAMHTDQVKEHAKCMKDLYAAFIMKPGEAGDRPRGITVPGTFGLEACHQARTAPIMQMLEQMYKLCFNHSMVKGQTDEDKRHSFGEFLSNMPIDWCTISFDKKANDSCWSQVTWNLVGDYHREVVEAVWLEWIDQGIYAEEDEETRVHLKNAFFSFTFAPFMMFLLTGIGPTSFFNRLSATIEEGVIALCVYGEEAYAAWKESRLNPMPSKRGHWMNNWKEGIKTTPRFDPNAQVACINEGDDKTGAFRAWLAETAPGRKMLEAMGSPVGADGKVTPSQLIACIVRVMRTECGFCYETARVPNQDGNFGRKSVLEFCSSVITIGKGELEPLAIITPKPIKALGKLTWSMTQAVNFERGVGNDSKKILSCLQDEKYHAFGATKYYSIAQVNQWSPGVGALSCAMGDMHHRELVAMVGLQRANSTLTNYDRRSAEARGIEESSSHVCDTVGALRDYTHNLVDRSFEPRECYSAAVAWQMALPDLRSTMPEIIASLLAFHESCLQIRIDMTSLANPTEVLEYLSFGCLTQPFLGKIAIDYRRMAKRVMKADVPDQDTVDHVKSKLLPITVGQDGKAPKGPNPKSAKTKEKKGDSPTKVEANQPAAPAQLDKAVALKARNAAAPPAARGAPGLAVPAGDAGAADGWTVVAPKGKGPKGKGGGKTWTPKDQAGKPTKGKGKGGNATEAQPKGAKGKGKGQGSGKGKDKSQRAPTPAGGHGRPPAGARASA